MKAPGNGIRRQAAWLAVAALLGSFALIARAQAREPSSPGAAATPESRIAGTLRTLRSLNDSERAATTRRLALEIRALRTSEQKERLALGLCGLATEGDPGQDVIEEVAATLAGVLKEHPRAAKDGKPDDAYFELAMLVRYEHVRARSDDPQFAAAMLKFEADDKARSGANFTLTDLAGRPWTLRDLSGKVVLMNFWATWCPPCRKEMPDLEALYQRFRSRGLVVLAISDEDAEKVRPFIATRQLSFPVLLDPGRKVNELFQVNGIPKSFLYDRDGKLVAQAIDMRTQRQFLAMLAQAGLE